MAIHIDMFLDKVMEMNEDRKEAKRCQKVFRRAVMLHLRQYSEVQWTSIQFLLIQCNFKSPSLEQFPQIQCQVHHLYD